MATAFKNGDRVRLKAPVIAGPVADIQYNKDAGELEYLVEYTDETGEAHQRWFTESALEEDPDAE